MLLNKSIIKKEICPYINFYKINNNTKVKDYQVFSLMVHINQQNVEENP
jgi:hypothetical protein